MQSWHGPMQHPSHPLTWMMVPVTLVSMFASLDSSTITKPPFLTHVILLSLEGIMHRVWRPEENATYGNKPAACQYILVFNFINVFIELTLTSRMLPPRESKTRAIDCPSKMSHNSISLSP